MRRSRRRWLPTLLPFLWVGFFLLGLMAHTAWGLPQAEIQPSAIGPSAIGPSEIRPNEIRPNEIRPSEGTLLEQGKRLYDAGRLLEALERWQRAEAEGAAKGDRLTQVRALRYRVMALQALGQWPAAAAILAEAEAIPLGPSAAAGLLRAQLQVTQGNLALAQGEAAQALRAFENAERLYAALGDRTGILLSGLNQAEALQSLGFYPRARRLLRDLVDSLQAEPDSKLKGRALRTLSRVLQSLGELDAAGQILKNSQDVFEAINDPGELAETLFQQGQLAQAQQQWSEAERSYTLAQTLSNQTERQIESAAQRIRVVLKNPATAPTQQAQAIAAAEALLNRLDRLPPGRWRFYAQVNLAQSLQLQRQLDPKTPSAQGFAPTLAPMLARAATQAKTLQDLRAASYLLGQLCSLYEGDRRHDEALRLSSQALSLARQIRADDMIASSLWQTGRILKAQGQTEQAIAVYTEAVRLLQGLRQDLVAVNQEMQFSFRDQVEPVYRQLVQLLLLDVDDLPEADRQARLERSRQTMEALQLAQLQNFLRQACETYQTQSIDQIDASAAVFYPIVTRDVNHDVTRDVTRDRADNRASAPTDRLDVILSLPGQPLQHYGSEFPQAEQQQIFRQLRQALNPAFPAEMTLPAAQKLYDRLIRPAEALLQRQQIQTLVFVLDGFLRNLPMAVLHDGDRYLIETYGLVLTPGLQLFDSRSLLSQQPPKLIAAGLTQPRQGFSSLPEVERELKSIAKPFLGDRRTQARVLLNRDFTKMQLAREVESQSYSIVHLATHGQFSSKAEDTFLVTWEDRLGIEDLEQWLQSGAARRDGRSFGAWRSQSPSPIELLVLSACQTAKGDAQATLGLAGLAIRSGARTTLATLWSVQDQSTADFMGTFYEQLFGQGQTRVEALRQAQLSLLKGNYAHPYYWAPFVLVGNWQS